MDKSICPVCGCNSFEDYRNVRRTRCTKCKSSERARAVKLFLDRYIQLRPSQRVLHFAPEVQLGKHIASIVGEGYEPVDYCPERYAGALGMSVRKIDLCRDAEDLPSTHYDLVLHNHVLEHVPCNYTLVLQHLHRTVKLGGAHLFSIPILAGCYEEDLNLALSEEQRQHRFGQGDHMRRFGREDFDSTIGAIFGLSGTYSLTDHFSESELTRANIRSSQWRCSGSSPIYVRKSREQSI